MSRIPRLPHLRPTHVLSLFAMLLLTTLAFAIVRAQPTPHARALHNAWQLAEESGRYHFTSQVKQSTLPAPRRSNVGATVGEDHLTVQGEIKGERAHLWLWDKPTANLDHTQALEVQIDDGTMQGRVAGGEWQALEELSDSFAPAGDGAAYLLAAQHVEFLGSERRQLLTGDQPLVTHHYHFALDGRRLAAYLTEQLEDQLRRKGELPPGMSLDMASSIQQIAGVGEAWLDVDGLPLRMKVAIEFPAQRNGERILVDVETNFSNFDRTYLILNGSGISNRLHAVAYFFSHRIDWQQTAVATMALLFFLAILLGLRLLSPARANAIISLSVLGALLTSQIAQAAPPPLPARFSTPNVAQQSERRPTPDAQPAFDNQQNPLAGAEQAPLNLPAGNNLGGSLEVNAVLDGPDADSDALPDSLEPVWTTNVNDADSDDDGLMDGEEVRRCIDREIGLASGKLTGENVNSYSCANPKDGDTDDDGLTDNQEVVFLGTSPNDKDSDGDALGDEIEVRGYLNATRFSNSLNPDTDGDGLLDGIECPNQLCADSDGDSELDIFDLDNDNDGFIGTFDSSPFQRLGNPTPFNKANPFQLALNNLSADKSVFVDFQIRPTNPNHIGYGQSVLDWPSGDTEGQIQRRLDTTFADANPLPPSVSAPDLYPQSYGDMRLVPMLEIEMDGTLAPLPRTTAAQTITFQSSPMIAVMQMFTQTEDVKFLGFTVSEPQALRLRVNKLSADYSNYSVEIHKAGCGDPLTTPLYSAPALSVGGETSFPTAEYSVIADGSHVALLKATGLAKPICIAIDKAAKGANYSPLNFELPLQKVGTLHARQAGSNLQMTLNLPNRSGNHDLQIFSGSCQSRQTQVATLPIAAQGSTTLNDRRLVDLANGNHVALLKKGEETLACSSLGNIVNGASSQSEMIDPIAMGKLGITVSEADAAGTLIAHIPLHLAHDARTGATSGFAGTMLYNSQAAQNWNHRVRMSWWVQMLTDFCATPADDFMPGAPEQDRLKAACGANANQMQLVHVYDEDWQLAGLSVREEHAYDTNVIFEDPQSDRTPESDDYLWHLARRLNEQFVTGVDCVRNNAGDSCSIDGARDYTLSTIYNTFHKGVNSGVSKLDRLGIESNAFFIEQLDSELETYLDQGKVMQSYVPAILNQHFLNNGTSRSSAPLLLFANENSFRTIALGDGSYATTSATGVTINFDPEDANAQPLKTIASLSWAPYRYAGAGVGWESYPIAEYWDKLAVRLQASRDFDGGESATLNIRAAGKIRLAQTYFVYLYSGQAGLVQLDNTAVGQWDSNAPLYSSRSEMELATLEAGDLIEVVKQGSLINLVIEPLAESIYTSYQRYKLQQWLIREDSTAWLLDSVLDFTGTDDIRSAENFWKNVKGDTGDALAESFFKNFQPGNLTRVGGKVTSGVGVGLIGASLLTGIAGGIYAASEGDGLNTAAQVLNGIVLANEIVGAVGMLATVNKAAVEAGELTASVIRSSLRTTSNAAKVAGVVGLIIGELINYSALAAQIHINGLAVGGLLANQIAAQSIASTLVAGMLFALASTGIGAIIVAIIGLIDGLVALICGFLDEDQTKSIPGQIFCKGISGWLTELVSFFIYAQNEITRINDPYRLHYLNSQPMLRNPAAGFVPNAPLDMTLNLRNTLGLANLPVNIGIFYGWQFDEDSLRSSRFAYEVVIAKAKEDEKKLHDSLTRGEGADPWLPFEFDGSGKVISVYDDSEVRSGDALSLNPQPGINQPVPGFLAEGYVVPVQECVSNATFTFPVIPPIVVCWVRGRGETNYNDLNLKFDLFPATLNGFYELELSGDTPGRYRQAWANNGSLPFPSLTDADGDGLRYDGDADDSRWDSDGDGLSDAIEQTRTSNPANPDSDEDGVSDLREHLLGTNPSVMDSDGDGLSDGEEVRGWSIGYSSSGATILTSWATSDPLERDSDRDAISDAQEKVYGFNPNLANDSTALVYEAEVNEPQSPLLLSRFEEGEKAITFADLSGVSGNNIATCVGDSCPSAGLRGRFGNALAFNGIDHYLAIAPNTTLGNLRTNITLSAWVKPSKLTGLQSVIHIGPGGANGAGGLSFGLNGTNLYVQFEGAQNHLLTLPSGTLVRDRWAHIAVELFDGTLLYYSVNGVVIGNVPSTQKAVSTNPEIIIGASQEPDGSVAPGKDGTLANRRINFFAGAIDEVVIQGWVALDDSAVRALFAGQYNPNDALLRPNQPVDYTSDLDNVLMTRQITGQRKVSYPPQLTNQPSTQAPFTLEPARTLRYAENFVVKPDTPSGVYTLTQSVEGIVSVPSEDVWQDPASNRIFNWAQTQSYNGTSNTTSGASQSINLNSKDFTIAAWIKPTSNDSQRRGILGRNSGQNNAFPYLLTVGQQLKFGFGTGSGVNAQEVSASDGDSNVLNLNQWNFVAARYALSGGSVTFYVNSAKLNTVATNATPNSTERSFLIGRASNLGKISTSTLILACEGDGIGDGEYDLIGSDGTNLWQGSGTEPTVWAPNITKSFNDSYSITMCEDDNDTRTSCTGYDEDMGIVHFSTDVASFSGASKFFANPADKSECAYDWGTASFPDLATLLYSFSNDSLPFIGDVRDIEIYSTALSDTAIANLRSHGDTVAQFRMDEIPQSSSFEDYIAYHQLNCSGTTCPQSGVTDDPKQNAALDFDGIDDYASEGGVATDDLISSDIASNNSGFSLSLWIKPKREFPPVPNRLTNIATFADSNGVAKGTLGLLVRADGFNYHIFYRDHPTGNIFWQNTSCFVNSDGSSPTGDWVHVSINMNPAQQTANLHVKGRLCSQSGTLQATYIPKRGDRFTLGRNFADPSYLPFQGSLDDLIIQRKPLTASEVYDLQLTGAFIHDQLDNNSSITGAPRPYTMVKGLVRNAALFNTFADRSTVINNNAHLSRIDGDIDQNPNTPNPITIGLWVRAEDLGNTFSDERPLLTIKPNNFSTNDFIFALVGGTPAVAYRQSTNQQLQVGLASQKIPENVWQHLLFRKDELGGMAIFINGYKASTITGNWDFSDVREPAGGLVLGADLIEQSSFKGRIDEVVIYHAALSDQEIRELYNYQSSWVDERVNNTVRVDADPPTSTLQLKTTYFANHPHLLSITTSDASSQVRHAELGVEKVGTAGITWVGAAADVSDNTGNSWLPLFEPSDEGAYTLITRATDSVGNSQTPGAGQTIYIDGKAPIININASANLQRPQADANEEAVWYLNLVGASFDPIIPNSGQQAGSGTASIDVHLTNGNGESATLLPTQRATVNPQTGEWTVRYKLNAANPTGEYQINAVAIDNVGNSATANPVKIKIDTTAPQAHITFLTSPTYQQAVAAVVASDNDTAQAFNAENPGWLGSDSTISGVVSEQPNDVAAQSEVAGIAGVEVALEPLFDHGSTFRNQTLSPATVLHLPFDESSRSDAPDQRFADLSPANQGVAICAAASCPTSGAVGRSGQALEFDGVDDSLVLTNVAAINGLSNNFTIGAWIKPQSVSGIQRIVSGARTASNNGFGFGIYEGGLLMTTYNVNDYITPQEQVTAGVWQHVAVHLTTDNTAEFYLNGQLVETVTNDAPGVADNDDPLLIGATTENGQSTLIEQFVGVIDEVVIVQGRPTASDWQIMLGMAPTLHLTFDQPFINPNSKLSNDAGLLIGDTAYLAGNLPAETNLRTVGKVGPGALEVKESEGSLLGAAATGVLPNQNDPFTMAFWGDLADVNARLAFWFGRLDGTQNRILVNATSVTLDFTGQPMVTATVPSLVGNWHHFLLSYDGATRLLYVDGVEVLRDTIATNTLNTIPAGFIVAGGTGALDDLRVYRYALQPNETRALAATGWRLASMVNAAAVSADSTWSAGVPAGLEGFYELQTRGFDALSNFDEQPRELLTWRGLVDSLAPRASALTSTVTGNGITFAWSVEDFDLAATTLQMPAGCTSSNTTQTTKRYESPWYRSFAEQTTNPSDANTMRNRTYQLALECRASYAVTNDTFKICDIAGNCSEVKYTGPNVGQAPPTATPTATPTGQPAGTATPTATPNGQSTPTGTPAPGAIRSVYLPVISKSQPAVAADTIELTEEVAQEISSEGVEEVVEELSEASEFTETVSELSNTVYLPAVER